MDKEKAELLNNRMRVALPRRILEFCWAWASHVHCQPKKPNVSWAAALTLPQLHIHTFSLFFGNWQKSSKLNQYFFLKNTKFTDAILTHLKPSKNWILGVCSSTHNKFSLFLSTIIKYYGQIFSDLPDQLHFSPSLLAISFSEIENCLQLYKVPFIQ